MIAELIKNDDVFIESTLKKENISQESKITYKSLLAAAGSNKVFTGYCSKCDNKGNLIIQYGNVNCIMERNDSTTTIEKDGNVHKTFCQNKVGVYIKFRVKKAENNTIYVTRKEIIKELREQYNNNLKIGDVVKGVVTDINENIGCFVNIGADYIAVLPKSNLEHIFVVNITDHVKIGDEIETVIKDIVRDEKQEIKEIILNRLPMLPKYEDLASAYDVGDVVPGIVKSITPNCIFVQITEHLNIYCNFNPNIRVEIDQKVRLRLKNISASRIRGDIIAKL